MVEASVFGDVAQRLALACSIAQHALWLTAMALLAVQRAPLWMQANALKRVAACAILMLLSLPMVWFTRGWLGELSVLNTVFCAVLWWRACRSAGGVRLADVLTWPLALALVLTGLVLYPSALHLVAFDVYAWGYFAPLCVLAALGSVALWWAGDRIGAIAVLAAAAWWALDAAPSPNLWDAVLDVALWCMAVAVGLTAWRRR